MLDDERKDIGRTARHTTYSDDYQRMLTMLTYKNYGNPKKIIQQWNNAAFGAMAESFWNKRLGLY